MPYIFRMVRYAGLDAATGQALYYTNRTTANAGETFFNLPGGKATNVYSTSDIQDITDKSPFPKVFGGFGTTLYKNLDVIKGLLINSRIHGKLYGIRYARSITV